MKHALFLLLAFCGYVHSATQYVYQPVPYETGRKPCFVLVGKDVTINANMVSRITYSTEVLGPSRPWSKEKLVTTIDYHFLTNSVQKVITGEPEKLKAQFLADVSKCL